MKDLTKIPEKFHILFIDDTWNKGNDSELSSLQRGNMNQLFLEYNSWSIKQALKKPVQETPITGFIKD
jgi:uncharacterized protein YecA (UPF0149 family)